MKLTTEIGTRGGFHKPINALQSSYALRSTFTPKKISQKKAYNGYAPNFSLYEIDTRTVDRLNLLLL